MAKKNCKLREIGNICLKGINMANLHLKDHWARKINLFKSIQVVLTNCNPQISGKTKLWGQNYIKGITEENNCKTFSPEKLIYVLKDHRLVYIQTCSNIFSWEKTMKYY